MINLFTEYDFPTFGWTRLPIPPITKEDRINLGLKENSSNSLFLRTLCFKGFEEKLLNGSIPKEKYQEYIDRCDFELKTFEELHFVDYILLVWATVEKARKLGVFIDWGRGSVSSSVVCWFLKISGCDPIKYELFFSRFISKARAKSKQINGEMWISISLAPDVDINLGDGRDEILKWLNQTYPNCICKISNLISLTGKLCVKDVYKTMEDVEESEAQRVADLVEKEFGVVQDLNETYNENDEFKKWATELPDCYNACLSLENLYRQKGVHASGYLIAAEDLNERTPLVLDTEKQITSAFVMDDAQSLKLDLLNLDTNRIIREILEKTKIDINKINLEDDPEIYKHLQTSDLLPYGLYQISAPCAYKVCLNIKPKNLLELSHVSAIARPTALAYERPYIENLGVCPHEIFRKALEWTRFQPIYQEQTIAMVKAIGFSEEEAEQFRRTFAKKKIEEIDQWVIKIQEQLRKSNLPEEVGEILVRLAKESAKYQFNFAHSISTSLLTACTVYLKYNYPIEFFIACLNDVKNKPNSRECLGQIQQELRFFGIKLLPPNILYSLEGFKKEGNNIRFGLSSIKGISDKTLQKLLNFNRKFNNKFEVFKAAKETKIPINVSSALILAGALDNSEQGQTPQERTRMMMEAQLFNLLTPREQLLVLNSGEKFNYDLISIIKYLKTAKDEKNKSVIKESRLETIHSRFKPYWEIYKHNVQNKTFRDFGIWYFEKELLGYSYTLSLQDVFRQEAGEILTIQSIKGELDNSLVRIVGEVSEFGEGRSKNKNKYWKFFISDQTGTLKVYFSNSKDRDKISAYKEDGGQKPKDGDIVIIRGSKKENVIFAQVIAIQDISVFKQISELQRFETQKSEE